MATRSKKTKSKQMLAREAWLPLAQFFFQTVKHRQQVLARYGLTPNDARALWVLDRNEGRSMRALSKAWACDASNATWIVDRLEQRGLATRQEKRTDRRVKLVVLTPRGEKTRSQLTEAMAEPPPELLELSLAELEALRVAAAKLPTSSAQTAFNAGIPAPAGRKAR